MCKISPKNIKLYGNWSFQSFQIFEQLAWFPGNNRNLSKFKYWILHCIIRIVKLQNNYSVKQNFILTTRATLILNTEDYTCLLALKTKNESEVRKVIKKLKLHKTCQRSDIPTKIIQNFILTCLVVLFVSTSINALV